MTTYQRHIDGLRAVAVMGVVLYHFGLGAPGGFVGVDVFFVISGFLISRIIYAELAAGTFSLRRFYERRLRRIGPAFLAVSAATTAVAYLILLPPEFASFTRSLMASLALAPNVYFYTFFATYFAPAANTLPLLHYWSLGIEEQFYLLFPLVLLAVSHVRPHRLPLVLFLMFIASFAAAAWVLPSRPAAVFYLLPFRAWEMLLGSIIAMPQIRAPRSLGLATGVTATGLAMVLAAMAWFDATTPFPGAYALVPAGGAALILWGSNATPNVTARFLSVPPVGYVGRISYSLYLVHWPLLVFAVRLFPYADAMPRGIALLVTSVGLAALSFRFIEQPFRRNVAYWSPRRLASISAASIAALLLVSAGASHRSHLSTQSAVRDMLAYQTRSYVTMFRSGRCFIDFNQPANQLDVGDCVVQAPGDKLVLIWGDSTGAHLIHGLKAEAPAGYSIGQATASSCPPVLDYDAPTRPNCRGFNDMVFARILSAKPDLLVLAATTWPFGPANDAKIEGTLERLAVAGISVVVLGPSPHYRTPVPTILANRIAAGNSSAYSDADVAVGLDAEEAVYAQRFSGRPNVTYVPMIAALCPGRRCQILIDGAPTNFDERHLTEVGSKHYAKLLLPRILAARQTPRSITVAPPTVASP